MFTTSHLSMRASTNIQVNLDEDLTDDEMQRMLRHIEQLTDIRMSPDFRLVFLFEGVSCSDFIEEFTDSKQTTMLKYLDDLEKNAVQLDCKAKGAKVSSVVGSFVGAIGGVLSVIGFTLLPVNNCNPTVCVALIIAGAVCGMLSCTIRIATIVKEICVNHKQLEMAEETIDGLLNDMQDVYNVLQKTSPLTKNKSGKKVLQRINVYNWVIDV